MGRGVLEGRGKNDEREEGRGIRRKKERDTETEGGRQKERETGKRWEWRAKEVRRVMNIRRKNMYKERDFE